MSAYIQIGSKGFTRIHSAKVMSSRKTITDTAVIKLANVKALLSDEKTKIKVGDVVVISLGYQDNNEIEFEGYVSEIKPTSPIEIMCEDEMWKLKQETITKSWETVKLVDVLKFIVPSINTVECPDMILSSFRLIKVTKAKALESIKEAYGLDIYFRGNKLFAGLAYTEKGFKTVKYHFQKNIPSRTLQTGLIYKRKEDVKIKVQAISMLPNNKQLTVNVGDDDGDTSTLHFFNLTEKELKQQAQSKIDLMKYDGYRGWLLAFGLPRVRHGDKVTITDASHLDMDGSFFADSVDTDYGPSGYRRIVSPGKKAE